MSEIRDRQTRAYGTVRGDVTGVVWSGDVHDPRETDIDRRIAEAIARATPGIIRQAEVRILSTLARRAPTGPRG